MENSSSFLGLRTCIYKVTDLEAAKSWYNQAFNSAPYFDTPFYVGYNIGGYELGLLPDETDTPAESKLDSVLTYWGVADVDATFAMLLAQGATEHEKPNDVGDGIMLATVKDPWGNVIGFICNPHFKPIV